MKEQNVLLKIRWRHTGAFGLGERRGHSQDAFPEAKRAELRRVTSY